MRICVMLVLAPLLACTRDITPVREAPPVEPEYLGPVSGVYAGFSGEDAGSSRTVVIQLRDRIVVTPFTLADGELSLSIFASVFDTGSDSSDVVQQITEIVSEVSSNYVPNGATCTSEGAPVLDFADHEAEIAACMSGGGACEVHCYWANVFAEEDSLVGECLAPGELCRYPLTLGWRVARGLLEIFFDQETVAPPSGQQGIPCPPGGEWLRCMRIPKLCDFDSRLAGVYQATLELDAEASSGSSPGPTTQQLEVAVAVANNMPAIIFFLSDESLGDRLMFGDFDPGTLTFAADDGSGPREPTWLLRDGAYPERKTTGTIVEDEGAGVVRLEGRWTETYEDAVAVYDLTATRLSGVTVGSACLPMGTCERQPLLCPMGNERDLRYSSLQIASELGDNGCPRTTCLRVLDAAGGLCAPLPTCGGLTLPSQHGQGTDRYESLLAQWDCPDGDPSCSDRERCLRFECHQEATHGPASSANWYQVDSHCDTGGSAVTLSPESMAGTRLSCSGDQNSCSAPAAHCPLYSSIIRTTLTPNFGDDGCVNYSCEQHFTLDQLCAGTVTPTCGSGESVVPAVHAKTGPSDPECIELVCAPSCAEGGSSCGGCEPCPDLDPMDCDSAGVLVRSGCYNCLDLRCRAPTCESTQTHCPLGPTSAVDTRLTPTMDSQGCLSTECVQYIQSYHLCADAVSPTCTAGESIIPEIRPSTSDPDQECVDWTCRTACNSACGNCGSCSSFDPVSCGSLPLRVTPGCEDGCPHLSCGVDSCVHRPSVCPLAAPEWLIGRDYHPQSDQDGCINWLCQQHFQPDEQGSGGPECDGTAQPSTLSCPTGEAPLPQERGSDGCLEYACAPICQDGDCGCCSAPIIPDGCGVGERLEFWVGGCANCIGAGCVPAP